MEKERWKGNSDYWNAEYQIADLYLQNFKSTATPDQESLQKLAKSSAHFLTLLSSTKKMKGKKILQLVLNAEKKLQEIQSLNAQIAAQMKGQRNDQETKALFHQSLSASLINLDKIINSEAETRDPHASKFSKNISYARKILDNNPSLLVQDLKEPGENPLDILKKASGKLGESEQKIQESYSQTNNAKEIVQEVMDLFKRQSNSDSSDSQQQNQQQPSDPQQDQNKQEQDSKQQQDQQQQQGASAKEEQNQENPQTPQEREEQARENMKNRKEMEARFEQEKQERLKELQDRYRYVPSQKKEYIPVDKDW